jgi:hypothetical protein
MTHVKYYLADGTLHVVPAGGRADMYLAGMCGCPGTPCHPDGSETVTPTPAPTCDEDCDCEACE